MRTEAERVALESLVAMTARDLYEHDIECRDYACLMREGCPERVVLMQRHNDAMSDLVERFPRAGKS